MKRLFTIIAVVLLSASAAQAQRFGVIGGFTSSYTSIDTKDAMANLKNVSLWHAGVAYNLEVGPFFAIQPQLLYQMKGADAYKTITEGTYQNAMNSFQSSTGYLELSAGLQFGIDILVARPYLLFEPFVGYAVYKALLEHFQVSVQWYMNLGNLYNDGKIDSAQIANDVKTYYKDIKNYQGIKITAALFF